MKEEKGERADTLVRATAAEGYIRCMAAVTTNTAAEAARRHQTTHTVSAALGLTLTGALLLGAGQKVFDRLTLRIEGDGPIGSITATPCEGSLWGGAKAVICLVGVVSK